nr:MAG TPA: hypothetical protein [Caudoviricetes sp.]DAW60390.1 MAG TPA: hypothetical protein [Caudoviricetes sp.]
MGVPAVKPEKIQDNKELRKQSSIISKHTGRGSARFFQDIGV